MIELSIWHWFALAAVMGILDIAMGANFILLWIGIVACAVGVVYWLIPTLSWEQQLLLFGIGSFMVLLVWHKVLKKIKNVSDKPHLNQRANQYIGREFTLQEPIINGFGKVRVDDTTWKISGEDLAAETKVKVVGVDGTVLKVEAS